MSYSVNGGYVSEIQKTGALIWDGLYTVRLPYKHTKSVDELREFGLPTVGNPMLDKQIHNELVTIMITIDAIVEHYRIGTKLILPVAKELDEIYTIVNNYLIAWKKQIECGINISHAPVDDLLLLDRFASELYQQARLINGDKVNPLSDISKLLGGKGLIGRDMLFKNSGAPTSEEKPAEDKHYSFSSIFSSKVFGGSAPEPKEPRKSTRWS